MNSEEFITRKGDTIIINFNDGIKTLKIQNKTLLTKIDGVVQDINTIDVKELYKQLFDFIDNESNTIDMNLLYSKALELVEAKISDEEISKFCNSSKRTKSSIYFDEKEMKQILELIGAIKIISFFIHSEYRELFGKLIETVAKHFKTISEKLYNVIKSRTYSFTREDLELVKYMISMNFLVLYNYEFILLSVLPHYNWKKNPLSFIVSVAGDNSNFLFLTYRAQSASYTAEAIDSASDVLETVSYELILKTVSENRTENYGYITSLTNYFALPIFSKISDIPVKYLNYKPKEEKLSYQRFLYDLSKFSPTLNKLLKLSAKLLVVTSEEPISQNKVQPVVLEVLKEDYEMYGIQSKKPLIEIATKIASVLGNRLMNMTTRVPFLVGTKMEEMIKQAIRVLSILTSDTGDQYLPQIKSDFLDMLGQIKADKSLF